MRFRWGWLEPVMPVPYVPTLGPVRREDPIPDLFEAVVETAGDRPVSPYDKDRRWSDRKAERVLVEAVEHDQERTLVPTLDERGAGTVKVHAYGGGLAEAEVLARQLAEKHGAAKARVVSFLGPEGRAEGGTRVQLKTFADGPGAAPGVPVLDYKQLPEGQGSARSPRRWRATASRSSTSSCGPGPSAPC